MFDNLASMHSAISLDWAVFTATQSDQKMGIQKIGANRNVMRTAPGSSNFLDVKSSTLTSAPKSGGKGLGVIAPLEDAPSALPSTSLKKQGTHPAGTRLSDSIAALSPDIKQKSVRDRTSSNMTERSALETTCKSMVRANNRTTLLNPDAAVFKTLPILGDSRKVGFAIACTISVADTVDSDDLSLIRDTVVDFGGDIVAITPFMNAAHNIFVTICFVSGHLPSRQTGVMTTLTRKQTLLNYASFLEHLCHDEHFSSSESPVKALSAAAGPIAVASKSNFSSLFVSGECVQESLDILTVSHDEHKVGDQAVITITEDVLNMDEVSDKDIADGSNSIRERHTIQELKSTDHRRMGKGARIKKKLFNVDLGTHQSLNPGMAMPVAFIRRFLNNKQLERCNDYLSASCSPILSDFVDRGVYISNLTGVFTETSLLFMYIGLAGDTHLNDPFSVSSNSATPSAGAKPGTKRTHRQTASSAKKKPPTPFLVFKLARKAIEIAEKELNKVKCDFLSAATMHTTLQISFAAHCAPEVAAYLCCRVQNALAKAKVTESFRCYVRYGEIPWRAGVNGGVFPYGHIVRSIAHNVHNSGHSGKFQGVFLQTDGVNADPSSSYKMLATFADVVFPEGHKSRGKKSVRKQRATTSDDFDENDSFRDASKYHDDSTDSSDDYDSDKDLEDSPSTRARKLASSLAHGIPSSGSTVSSANFRGRGRDKSDPARNLMSIPDYNAADQKDDVIRKQSSSEPDVDVNTVTRLHPTSNQRAEGDILTAYGNTLNGIGEEETLPGQIVTELSSSGLPVVPDVASADRRGSFNVFFAETKSPTDVVTRPQIKPILRSAKHTPQFSSAGSFSQFLKKWVSCTDKLTPACKKVHADSSVVGREELQDILFQQVEALLIANETTITLLEAKGGYGKSSIADSIMALAKALKLTHVRVQSDEASMHDPWAPWKPIIGFLCTAAGMYAKEGLDPILDLLDIDSTERRRAALWLEDILPVSWTTKKEVAPDCSSSLRLSGHERLNLDKLFDEEDEMQEIEEEEANMQASGMLSMKLELFDMLIRALFEQAGSLVLVIEDLHWMDTSSWKLMRRICTVNKGVMIVCTNRPVSKSQAADFAYIISNGHRCRKEVLKRLDPDDLYKMAENSFPSKHVSTDFHERLVTVSRGFAFLASELLRQAKEDPSASILFRGIKELKSLMELEFGSPLPALGNGSHRTAAASSNGNDSRRKKMKKNVQNMSFLIGKKPSIPKTASFAAKTIKANIGGGRRKESILAKSTKKIKGAIKETSVYLRQGRESGIDSKDRKNSMIELAEKGSGKRVAGFESLDDGSNKVSHLEEWLSELRKEEYLSTTDGDLDRVREGIHERVMETSRLIGQASDMYTPAETSTCDQFYNLVKTSDNNSNVGWERVSSHSGVDYYVSDDGTGSNYNFKQAKSTTSSENCR